MLWAYAADRHWLAVYTYHQSCYKGDSDERPLKCDVHHARDLAGTTCNRFFPSCLTGIFLSSKSSQAMERCLAVYGPVANEADALAACAAVWPLHTVHA